MLRGAACTVTLFLHCRNPAKETLVHAAERLTLAWRNGKLALRRHHVLATSSLLFPLFFPLRTLIIHVPTHRLLIETLNDKMNNNIDLQIIFVCSLCHTCLPDENHCPFTMARMPTVSMRFRYILTQTIYPHDPVPIR